MERWTSSVIVTARHYVEVDQFNDSNGEAQWRGGPVQCSVNALYRGGPVQCIVMRHCGEVDQFNDSNDEALWRGGPVQ